MSNQKRSNRSKHIINQPSDKYSTPISSQNFGKYEELCTFNFKGWTVFKLFLAVRCCAAMYSTISDCDETYNYWEPLHYLIYGKGLQTWEYSPEFALRSYAYLWLHALPALVYQKIFSPSPLHLFYFVRSMLAVICAACETVFYRTICIQFGASVGQIWLWFQLFAAGMFISSTALLPSSFAMYCVLAAFTSWWSNHDVLTILFIALGSLMGWPFSAVLGIPIAFYVVFIRRRIIAFVLWSFVFGCGILAIMTAVDSYYFGRLVIAPLNIIIYNVLTDHGPNLYGMEPISYYFINGFLNFNVSWALALLSPLIIAIVHIANVQIVRNRENVPVWLSISPAALWMIIFNKQPHKEERFLFPIYPLITLCGAITLTCIHLMWTSIHKYKKLHTRAKYNRVSHFMVYAILCVYAILGISRMVAITKNYSAPMDVTRHLYEISVEESNIGDSVYNVCLGKEWYRFPSSFFLPNEKWHVRFIESEFNGILPFTYSYNTSDATSIVHKYFNDENKAEPEALFDIRNCHFLIDFDNQKYSLLEPNYLSKTHDWRTLKSIAFLNAEKSSRWFRAFYIYPLSSWYTVSGNYSLLVSTKVIVKNIIN